MTWEPLTRVWCAESERDGTLFAHTYDAPDTMTAKKIAVDNGWVFLGELVDEGVEDDVVAMVEKAMINPTIH